MSTACRRHSSRRHRRPFMKWIQLLCVRKEQRATHTHTLKMSRRRTHCSKAGRKVEIHYEKLLKKPFYVHAVLRAQVDSKIIFERPSGAFCRSFAFVPRFFFVNRCIEMKITKKSGISTARISSLNSYGWSTRALVKKKQKKIFPFRCSITKEPLHYISMSRI